MLVYTHIKVPTHAAEHMKPATSVKGSSLTESFLIDFQLLIFMLVAFL